MSKKQKAIEAKKVLDEYEQDLKDRINKRLGLDCLVAYHNHYRGITFTYFSHADEKCHMISEFEESVDHTFNRGFSEDQIKIILEEFEK